MQFAIHSSKGCIGTSRMYQPGFVVYITLASRFTSIPAPSMNNRMTNEQNPESAKWNVSLAQLTMALVWLFLGAALAELVRNISGAEKVTFSTTELVGFVLSVVLSAASIVLAIAAIWLGKISELSMVRRSDESIRMQNEVYIKTTEALKRIESSTDVTEKRIEDIIAGRAGDISHRIAELTSGRTGLSRDPASLEREIRRIIEGTKAPKPEDEVKRREAMIAHQKRYKAFHGSLLAAFANKADSKAVKLGDGSMDAEGIELFDVVVQAAGKTIAGSAFQARSSFENTAFPQYLLKVSQALASGAVDQVVLAFDRPTEDQPKLAEEVKAILSVYKGEPEKKVTVVCAEEAAIIGIVDQIKFS